MQGSSYYLGFEYPDRFQIRRWISEQVIRWIKLYFNTRIEGGHSKFEVVKLSGEHSDYPGYNVSPWDIFYVKNTTNVRRMSKGLIEIKRHDSAANNIRMINKMTDYCIFNYSFHRRCYTQVYSVRAVIVYQLTTNNDILDLDVPFIAGSLHNTFADVLIMWTKSIPLLVILAIPKMLIVLWGGFKLQAM